MPGTTEGSSTGPWPLRPADPSAECLHDHHRIPIACAGGLSIALADALVGLIPTATTPATAMHAAAIHRARFFFGLASSLSVMPHMMTIRTAH